MFEKLESCIENLRNLSNNPKFLFLYRLCQLLVIWSQKEKHIRISLVFKSFYIKLSIM